MSDFELASRNAIKYHFPNVERKGCWFHFRQAVNRRVIKIGLKKRYGQDNYRKFINLLGALALLPVEKVEEAFKLIKSFMPKDSKCTELYEYFERQWIKSINFFNKFFQLMH